MVVLRVANLACIFKHDLFYLLLGLLYLWRKNLSKAMWMVFHGLVSCKWFPMDLSDVCLRFALELLIHWNSLMPYKPNCSNTIVSVHWHENPVDISQINNKTCFTSSKKLIQCKNEPFWNVSNDLAFLIKLFRARRGFHKVYLEPLLNI